MREQLIALENHSDLLAKLRQILALWLDLFPIQKDLTFLDRLKCIDTTKQGTFTAPTRSNDHNDFSLLYRQVHIIQYHIVSKTLFQMLYC